MLSTETLIESVAIETDPLGRILVAAAVAQAQTDTPDPTPTPTAEEATLTEIGQMAPDFSVETLDGKTFTLSEQKNKVVLINWFATWCPPCQKEMPHLQKEVWEAFADQGLVMISVARQEKADVVSPFVKKFEVTWPFGLDPDRKAFANYATAFIPRNTLVGPDGRIIFQSQGFVDADFKAMIKSISKALADQG